MLGKRSPGTRNASPAKNSKICDDRVASSSASGSVLPSSRASRSPSASRWAAIAAETRISASWRTSGVARDHAGKAARAATTAIVTRDTIDSVVKSTFIRKLNGMASAGAKLVPFANEV